MNLARSAIPIHAILVSEAIEELLNRRKWASILLV